MTQNEDLVVHVQFPWTTFVYTKRVHSDVAQVDDFLSQVKDHLLDEFGDKFAAMSKFVVEDRKQPNDIHLLLTRTAESVYQRTPENLFESMQTGDTLALTFDPVMNITFVDKHEASLFKLFFG